MKYLLDTCVVSDFVRGEPGTQMRLKSLSPEQVVLSAVSLMEIEYGLALDPPRARKIAPMLRDLLESVDLADYGAAEARATGTLRAALRQRGEPIGPFDVQIAGTALANGMVLVTANVREFSRVNGLVVENWRAG